MKHYRKIWEEYYNACLMPGIEIHHIDGNHDNCSIDNLLAVTPEEHFYIHLANGDYGAASLISNRATLPLNEVVSARIRAGQIGGTNSRDNNLGFFAMSTEEKRKISTKAGIYTRDNKLGIHAINANPVLAKKNSSNAGKMAHKKNAGIHARPYQKESVGGTIWWIHKISKKRKRSAACPGTDWIKGMGESFGKGKPSGTKGMLWWNDGNGNRIKAKVAPNTNWRRGIK